MTSQGPKALSEPKVLLRIFQVLDNRSNTRNARVCRVWCSIATAVLWDSVDFRVVRALTASTVDPHGVVRFHRHPRSGDWARFLQWSCRVRRFCGSGYGSEIVLHPETYSTLLFSPSRLFPHLTELRVDVVHLREPFVASSITRLFLLITGKLLDIPDAIGRTLSRLPASLPNVSFLRVDGDRQIYPFTAEVAKFCRSLPRLEHLVLSSSVVASPLLKVLSTSCVLKSVRVAEHSPSDHIDEWRAPLLALSVPVSLQPGAFEALLEIGFIARTTLVASRFILDACFPTKALAHLWIRFPQQKKLLISAKHVQSLIFDLANACWGLQSLVLRFADTSGPSPGTIGSSLEQLSFQDIEGFLEFKSLCSFAIDHNLPLFLRQEDIQSLAPRASRFTSLSLNPYPLARDGIPSTPPLPLSCLAYLAVHCPRLENLALQVNGSQAALPFDPVTRFQRLRSLFLGWSSIPVFAGGHERVEVWECAAEFLAVVLPTQTELKTVFEYGNMDRMELVSGEVECQGMLQMVETGLLRRNGEAWRSVWAMTRFLQNLVS